MKYKDLARTFEIFASKDPNNIVMDWAEHDEWGIDLHYTSIELSPSEVRELAEMGWGLGSDNEYDEETMHAWIEPTEHTDEELMELWNEYKSIYKYA